MSEVISLSVDTLRKLLEEAYDEGWHGSIELKQSAVSKLFRQCKKEALGIEEQVESVQAYNHKEMDYLKPKLSSNKWDLISEMKPIYMAMTTGSQFHWHSPNQYPLSPIDEDVTQ